MDEPKPLIPEEQEIRDIAEKILAAKGKKSEHSYYQPAISVGGDYMVHATEHKFRKNGITIIKYEERLDDEICQPYLMILDTGKGAIGRFFNSLGMYDGSVVFSQEGESIKTFEKGDWQKRLENLVA
jgi:hypothetical protein